jgi:hypothetical protein
MSRFGQVLTMREESLLFTRVEEELLRILKRWAAQQDGELSPYQKGPQPWRGVLKMLSDTGSGRGVAQQFQRAHRAYSRAGDEAGRQNLEYRLKEAWNQARGNYKYNIGRRTNAFGNLSGSEADHAEAFRNAAQSLLRSIQRLYGRKPDLQEIALIGQRYGFMSAHYTALTNKTQHTTVYDGARAEYLEFLNKLERN